MHVWVERFVKLVAVFPVILAALSRLQPEAEQRFALLFFLVAALAALGECWFTLSQIVSLLSSKQGGGGGDVLGCQNKGSETCEGAGCDAGVSEQPQHHSMSAWGFSPGISLVGLLLNHLSPSIVAKQVF